jgi:4,5-dihydroxyphthalate decarboxylase
MTQRRTVVLACNDYDRTRALRDGDVRANGVDLVYLSQVVE